MSALAVSANVWYAATPEGVFRSRNRGDSWEQTSLRSEDGSSFSGAGDYLAIAASGRAVYAARRQGIMVSQDEGVRWQAVMFPAGLTALETLALMPDGSLWAGGREGVFYSTDGGHSWNAMRRLPLVAVNSVSWDPALGRVIVSSWESTLIFAIDPHNQTWKWWNTGWTVRSAASLNGRLVASSLYSGVVAQPQTQVAAAGGGVEDARH